MPRTTLAKEPFGPALEKLMATKGVTYRAMAEKCGLSAGYLNHIVHGNRPVPGEDVIGRIAAAVDVQPEHFLEVRLRRIGRELERNPVFAERLYKQLAA